MNETILPYLKIDFSFALSEKLMGIKNDRDMSKKKWMGSLRDPIDGFNAKTSA